MTGDFQISNAKKSPFACKSRFNVHKATMHRHLTAVFFLLGSLFLVPLTGAPPTKNVAPRSYPLRTDPVCAGQIRVSGWLSIPAAGIKVEVNYRSIPVAAHIDRETGAFTILLTEPLEPGAMKLTPSAGNPQVVPIAPCSGASVQSAKPAGGAAANIATGNTAEPDGLLPTTLKPIVEGDSKITGAVKIVTSRVQLFRGGKPLGIWSVPDANGNFSFSDVTPLINQEFQAVPEVGKPSGTVTVAGKGTDPKPLGPAIVNPAFVRDVEVTGTVRGDSGQLTVCIEGGGCTLPVAPRANGTFSIPVPALAARQGFKVTQEKGKDTDVIHVTSRPVVTRVLKGDKAIQGRAIHSTFVKYCWVSSAPDDVACKKSAATKTDVAVDSDDGFQIPFTATDLKNIRVNDKFVVVQDDGVTSLPQTILGLPTVKPVKAGSSTVEVTVANGETLVKLCLVDDTVCRNTKPDAASAGVVTATGGKFTIQRTDANGKPMLFKENTAFVVLSGPDPSVESAVQEVAPSAVSATFAKELKEGDRVVSGNAPGANGVEIHVYPVHNASQLPMTPMLLSASVDSDHVVGEVDHTKVKSVQLIVQHGQTATNSKPVEVDATDRFDFFGVTLAAGDYLRVEPVPCTNCLPSRLYPLPIAEHSQRPVTIVSRTVDPGGSFDAVLPSILNENDEVTITPFLQDASLNKAPGIPTAPQTVFSSEYDWGRVRAYFSIGAITGKDDNNFSKYHPYVSLNIDYNWLRWPMGKNHTNYLLVNNYFEGRLTNTATTAVNTTTNQVTLLNADSSAQIEVGMYMPFNTEGTTWHFRGQRQVLFAGPVIKGGFVTVSDPGKASVNGTCSTNPSSLTYSANCRDTVALDNSNIFAFYAAGIRFGHYYQPKNSRNVGPKLIDYLDLSMGRWGNLPAGNFSRAGCSVAAFPAASLTGVSGECISTPWRFQATGRMAIPLTPFTIGFNSIAGKGPDLMQFFLGSRFDIAPVLQKLIPSLGK